MKNTVEHSRHRTGLVTLVIPAKNEAEAIGATLSALPLETLHAAGFETEVVILDGNSRDGTARIAAEHGATIVCDPEPGKGAAFRNGRSYFHGDYVVMLDADGTYATDAIPRTVSLLAWDDADIVMGQRRIQEDAMSPIHRVGNAMLSLGASMLYGRACPDVCTGLWGFRKDALDALPITSQGFELEAELFSLSCRLGLRIAHVPVDYLPRKGETKLSSTRDGLRIGWCLVRSRFVQVEPREPGEAQADRSVPGHQEDPVRAGGRHHGLPNHRSERGLLRQRARASPGRRIPAGRRGPAPDVSVPVEVRP